jgi:hypothetical protein
MRVPPEQGSFSQAFAVATAGTHAIAFRAAVRNFKDHSHDFAVRVDGLTVVTIKPAQMSTGQWRDFSITLTLQPGEHTLSFVGLNTLGGDNSSFIDDVRIADPAGNPVALKNPGFESVALPAHGFVYGPPGLSTPGYRLDAVVATSGESIHGRLVKLSDPTASVPLGAVATMPTIEVNGLPVAVASTVAEAGHDGFLWLLDGGATILPGDSVTITAPRAWATAAGDFAAAMDEMPVENCAGRSYVGTDPTKATLRVGWNIAHGATQFWGTYSVNKNLLNRILRWDPAGAIAGADRNWLPTAITKPAFADVIHSGNNNGMDATGVPVPEGLYALGWGATTPTTSPSLVSNDGVVTERADLANPGDADGNGKVRVFDVRRKPGSTSASVWIQLRMEDKGGAPRFGYLVCYGPKDFNPTAPVVLEDVHDPAALSQTYKDRLGPGIGSMRFVDSTPVGTGGGNACEPEHLLWAERMSWAGYVANWQVQFTQARPWTHDRSPYVYSAIFGQPYAAASTPTSRPARRARSRPSP